MGIIYPQTNYNFKLIYGFNGTMNFFYVSGVYCLLKIGISVVVQMLPWFENVAKGYIPDLLWFEINVLETFSQPLKYSLKLKMDLDHRITFFLFCQYGEIE